MSGSFKKLVRNLRRMSELTRTERDALLAALVLHEACGLGFLTGRKTRRATMMRLVAKRFAEEKRLRICDGDGWAVEPERYRVGFMLTPVGIQVARMVRAQDARAEKEPQGA